MSLMQTLALTFVVWMWLSGLIDAAFPNSSMERIFAVGQALVALALLLNVEAWLS
jgi:hypothetical protein